RQADVAESRLLREGMRRLVDPPLALVEAEGLEHPPAGLLLADDRKRSAECRVVDGIVAMTLDQTDQLRLQTVEDGLHVRRGHSLLVLVESHVVRGVVR